MLVRRLVKRIIFFPNPVASGYGCPDGIFSKQVRVGYFSKDARSDSVVIACWNRHLHHSGSAMSDFGISSGLAAQTLAEIAEIDRRIASLVELREGLKRVFANASGSGASETAYTQPGGSRRAMVERVVVEMLGTAAGSPLKTRELFEGVRTVSAHLKYVTFRSYLHRLKQRGVITAENAAYGSWKLSEHATGHGDDRFFSPGQ